MMPALQGKTVAVVGCGSSPMGKGYGREIDAHAFVVRVNRSFMTNGIEHDWGSRVDALVIGNPAEMMRLLPPGLPVPVIAVPQAGVSHAREWEASKVPNKVMPSQQQLKAIWPHARKPLAGTFAALLAAHQGAASLSLYGIDLYCDVSRESGRSYLHTAFKGHINMAHPITFNDLSIDLGAIMGVRCELKWKPGPPLL